VIDGELIARRDGLTAYYAEGAVVLTRGDGGLTVDVAELRWLAYCAIPAALAAQPKPVEAPRPPPVYDEPKRAEPQIPGQLTLD